jgi:hypothetical protein
VIPVEADTAPLPVVAVSDSGDKRKRKRANDDNVDRDDDEGSKVAERTDDADQQLHEKRRKKNKRTATEIAVTVPDAVPYFHDVVYRPNWRENKN